MKVFFNVPEIIEDTTVAIGTFDGVHLGHRAVLASACQLAKENNQRLIIFTFVDHPAIVTGSKAVPQLLTTAAEKLARLEAIGIDYCVIPEFSRELSLMTPEDFVRDILLEKLKVKNVCVGFNFFFGHKASGNRDTLKELAGKYHFQAVISEPELIEKQPVSSSVIRNSLLQGDLSKANNMLGYSYSLTGRVIRGKGIAKTVLGIPTANLAIDPRKLIPRNGVYACNLTLEGKTYQAVTNIGNRPSFDNGEKSIEAHIIDFEQDLYEKEVTISLEVYLREEKKFSDLEELKKQILADREEARKLLSLS